MSGGRRQSLRGAGGLVVALATAVLGCSAPTPLLPDVDLLVLPPVGAALAGAPDTPDYPPPGDPAPEAKTAPESSPEPDPEPDADPEWDPESPEAEAEPDAEPDAEPEPEPEPEAAAVAPQPLVVPPPPTERVVTGAGFSYLVPAAWRELDPGLLGVPTLVTAQRDTAPLDGFVTNVSVAVEPFAGDSSTYGRLHAAALADAEALRDVWPSSMGSWPAVDVTAYWPNIHGVPYFTLQRYVADGERGYVVTCAASATALEAERPLCEEILDSFQLE